MITHISLGTPGFFRSRKLYLLIKAAKITLGGNLKDNIYGTLRCRSGRRMKPENRVFFAGEQEAIITGYRPCAHCMPVAYKNWKNLRSAD